MTECKHGLKSGCAYCHVPPAPPPAPRAARRPRGTGAARRATLADKMNDRMAALRRRLRELRGEG